MKNTQKLILWSGTDGRSVLATSDNEKNVYGIKVLFCIRNLTYKYNDYYGFQHRYIKLNFNKLVSWICIEIFFLF